MSLAVISDVHGNIDALEAVIADIDKQGIKRIFCLGDIVGYGPDPVECVDLVMQRCEFALCGNHDVAVLSQAFGFNKLAKKAIDWTRDQIKPGIFSGLAKRRRWSFLKNLLESYQEDKMLFVHGSPRDPIMEYIEESDTVDMGFGPSDKIVEVFELVEWLCFVGHTHRSGVITDDVKFLHIEDLPDMTFMAEEGRKAVVNVGSVGQPRDRDPRACYVVIDLPKITYKRVEYDVEKVIEKYSGINALDERLATRLRQGK